MLREKTSTHHRFWTKFRY